MIKTTNIKNSLFLFLHSLKKGIFRIFVYLREEKGGAFSLGLSLIMTALIGLYLIKAESLETVNSQMKIEEKTENVSMPLQESIQNQEKVAKKIKMLITAYSSTPEETDETPFITASGREVRDGIVANNMLPFGTKIRIPELYGEKIFVVEDRLHWRKSNYHIDIWFPTKEMAKNFGVKIAEVEILEKIK